jgi:hypothetical protein
MMHKGSYVRSGWNVLDLTIVVAGLTDFTLTQARSSRSVRRGCTDRAALVTRLLRRCLFVCLLAASAAP